METSRVVKTKDPLDDIPTKEPNGVEQTPVAANEVNKNGMAATSSAPKPIPLLKAEYIMHVVPEESNRKKVEPLIPETSEVNKPESVSGESTKTELPSDETQPPPTKKIKTEKKPSKHAERKAKVQRPVGSDFAVICHAIAASEECQRMATTGECRWSHDLDGFLATSPQPLDGPCPSFRRFGKCRFGLVCRFRLDHSKVDESGKLVNLTDEAKWNEQLTQALSKLPTGIDTRNFEQVKQAWNWNPDEMNHIGKELAITLKKRQYTFIKSVLAQHQVKTKQNSPNRSYVIVPKERPNSVDFKNKLILAPLTTIGNLPFRRICKRFGADITIGEMALTVPLLQGAPQEWALVQRHESEDIFGVQIAGHHIDQCSNVVEVLNKHMKVDFIDLNVGCPIDLMCQQGMGSALLQRITRLEDIVTAMSQTSQVPITVKVRIGRDWEHPVTHAQVAPVVHQWGASALTVHGRSKEQRYRAEANWDYIEKCGSVCKVPLIGNGDVYNFEEAEQHLASGNISSLMLARGAIIKPWLFTEIKERRHWDISANERFDILKEFVNNGLEHWGSDNHGCEKTRYFLLNWLSFLCRYTPVGLLERVPIKIGQKPGRFYGRNDLETLMGSPEIEDMIKISSMLLGPPPENFKFEPKHKAGG